ncbi:MAG: M15 family metallopeptidase [Hominimerdicola sp.]
MDYLILVDRFNPLPNGFENNIQFTEIGGKLFEKQAGERLAILMKDAENDGLPLSIISGYRCEEYQQMLWERSISTLMWSGLSFDEAMEETAKTLALPRSSEHNTGLAVDFGCIGDDDVSDDFYRTGQSKWLSKNASRYGFILRYPRLKEHITGISFEPWHYRYVGTESAEIIHKSGICLEEFLHFYSEKYI